MFRTLSTVLLLSCCLSSCVLAGEIPSFTPSTADKVKLGRAIVIHVEFSQGGAEGIVLFYRVMGQPANSLIELKRDTGLPTRCYVWADTPGVYRVEVEAVRKTDAESRCLKDVEFEVYGGSANPPQEKSPDPPNKPAPRPPRDTPNAPETPTPENPPPEREPDLGGLFGIAPLLRDKILELVPAEHQGKAADLAEGYRLIALDVARNKISTLTAPLEIAKRNGSVLKTPEEKAAWKELIDWMAQEFLLRQSTGQLSLKDKRDVAQLLSEVSLGLFLVGGETE